MQQMALELPENSLPRALILQVFFDLRPAAGPRSPPDTRPTTNAILSLNCQCRHFFAVAVLVGAPWTLWVSLNCEAINAKAFAFAASPAQGGCATAMEKERSAPFRLVCKHGGQWPACEIFFSARYCFFGGLLLLLPGNARANACTVSQEALFLIIISSCTACS